jgi:SAM-dependent methyltransferase
MNPFEILTTCRICRGSQLKTILDLGSTPLANEFPSSPQTQERYPLYIAQCQDCEHVQLPVSVPPEVLFSHYTYRSDTSPSYREHLSRAAKALANLANGGLVLEIGSNDGTLLREFQALGCSVLGIEPAQNLAQLANERGVPTQCEFWNSSTVDSLAAKHGYGFASVIVANNVYAHVPDIRDFTKAVHHALKPGGIFAFEVGYLPDQLSRGLFSVIYHEHTSYHHLAPLVRLLREHGLHLFDAHRVPTQGGSVRCYAVKAELPDTTRSWSLRQLLEEERSAVASLDTLAARSRTACERIGANLWDLQARGKTVAAYGAPARMTTIVYASSLTSISCVFDDNPEKIGKYTPGRNWPVVSSADLMARNPDALVLFSANFKDEIQARFPDWKGTWIVPEEMV